MTFSEKILSMRQLRIQQIEEAISKTTDFLKIFPRDLYLPSKLENLKMIRDTMPAPDDPSIVHIEELRAYKSTKS